MKAKLSFLTCALAMLLCGAIQTFAQETVADTLRINTRVVFMDALVKDKRTGLPVSGLREDNFEVYDEGQPRHLSYFTREGQARQPLALVLVLDLRDDGAGRFLRRPENLSAINAELAKMAPEDKVAIVALCDHEDSDEPLWLTRLTNDRAQTATALNSIPALMEKEEQRRKAREREAEEAGASGRQAASKGTTVTTSVSTDKKDRDKDSAASKTAAKEAQVKDADVASVTTYPGKDGSVVTRTVKKDGTIITKRENRNKTKTVEIDNDLDLFGVTKQVTDMAAKIGPAARVSVVWVSDGLTPIFFEQRDALEEMLVRSNVTFNAMTVEMKTTYKLLLPLAKPITNWVGMSITGVARRFSEQTGGEVVRVHRPDDYARGLNKIIGSLNSRYGLGFALAEQDQFDGRLHHLDVRVRARDEKGKDRKLLVSARKGYYAPLAAEQKAEQKEAAVTKQ